MNTIYENNGDIKNTSISNTSSSVTTNTSNGHQSLSQSNGVATARSSSASTSSSDDYLSDLKIIGHLRNIEKINEKRRVFLTNTISETNTEECQTTETKNVPNSTHIQNGKATEEATTKDIIHIFNAEKHFLQPRSAEELLDSSSDLDLAPLSPKNSSTLRSPMTPPPKPPMLSRNRSINGSADRAALQSPVPQDSSELPIAPEISKQTSVTAPLTAAIVTTKTLAEPVQATTVELAETPVVLRRVVDRPKSLSPETTKQISANHYERLIEELKCPGCAYPMKGQVLLCKTGHSICAQCTRVLMLCPLCKEPFTNIRSLTVEALASKAHFRCVNASGGCTVRLQIDLLGWHEKQCIYKPMKCFMGRVYGDCTWTGREANWKEHLEVEHSGKVFTEPSAELVWDMGVKQKPLTGYYVFEVFDEMFNFYEIYDKERVLFTMSCTSTVREKKHNFAFEVTMIHQDNEALAITQKFPVHSEYDNDILLDGTCVSISLADLAKFIDDDKLLHYRVRVLEVNSPRKSKAPRQRNFTTLPLDFKKTQIQGVNLKNVPSDVIVTRKCDNDADVPYIDSVSTPNGEAPTSAEDYDFVRQRYSNTFRKTSKNSSDIESDPEFEAFIAKKWGTPQLNFNRKYLKNSSSDSSSAEESSSHSKNKDTLGKLDKKFQNDTDKASICSTSYKKKMSNTLRKSFRSLKTDIIEMKPFGRKSSPEKNVAKANT